MSSNEGSHQTALRSLFDALSDESVPDTELPALAETLADVMAALARRLANQAHTQQEPAAQDTSDTLRDVCERLRQQLASAYEDLRNAWQCEDLTEAREYWASAIRHARTSIATAKKVHRLSATESTQDMDLAAAEESIGVPPGFFEETFEWQKSYAEDVRSGLNALTTLDQELKKANAFSSLLLSSVLRICTATLIGGLIGAPLGALAVHENLITEGIKGGIAAAATTTGFEIMDHRRKREAPSPEPLWPDIPVDHSTLDLDSTNSVGEKPMTGPAPQTRRVWPDPQSRDRSYGVLPRPNSRPDPPDQPPPLPPPPPKLPDRSDGPEIGGFGI